MKLVHYFVRYPHKKNHESIKRMCSSCNIEYEETNSVERVQKNDYDILLALIDYVDPHIIPANIKIFYGPHFSVFPSGPIVGKLDAELSKRCVFNLLSEWVGNLWMEFVDSLIFPIFYFTFSVNTENFIPSNHKDKEIDCIVYIKRRKQTDIDYLMTILNNKNLKYQIFKYGSYDEQNYKNALNKCKFMISLDAHESQGFALEEAMSCNIPLLVIDAKSMYDECDDGHNATYAHLYPKKMLATSVPYWSDQCGIKIYEKNEISNSIDNLMINYESFSPRQYIVDTLSDKVCMERMLSYFKIESI